MKNLNAKKVDSDQYIMCFKRIFKQHMHRFMFVVCTKNFVNVNLLKLRKI